MQKKIFPQSIFHLYPLRTKNLPNSCSCLQCRRRAAPAQRQRGLGCLVSRGISAATPRRSLGGARGGRKAAVLWLRSLGVEVLAWHRDGMELVLSDSDDSCNFGCDWMLMRHTGTPVERSSSQGSSGLNKLRADSLVCGRLAKPTCGPTL